MAFVSTQTDYYGLSSSTMVCTTSEENKSATVVQAHNEKGDLVAQDICGETEAPNCSYVLKADTSLGTIKLGYPITVGSKKYAMTSFAIDTGAGSPPGVQASGELVPDNSHTDCYYQIPAATVKVCHHAQILWSAFSLTGSGCYLTQANYSAESNLSKATKDGSTVAYDVTEGQIQASITVQQTGTTSPTLSAGTGWVITSPMTCSNPDADYPSWTATLSMPLEHATQS